MSTRQKRTRKAPEPKPGEPGCFKRDDVVLFKAGEFPRDAYTVMEALQDGGLRISPMGGGRFYHVRPDQVASDNFRKVDPATHPRTWRKARFSLECGDEKPTMYTGYTDGRRYNSWDVPFFTLAVAKKIAKELGGAYDAKRGALVFPVDDTRDQEEVYEGELIPEAHSESLFCLGNGGWVWFEEDAT